MKINDIFDLSQYDNAYKFVSEKKGTTIVDLGEGQYKIVAIPEPLPPTKEEQQKARAEAYRLEKDPITCQINSLRDEEQTPEVIAEIASLVEERKAKVAEIKARYPYSEEVIQMACKGKKKK